MNSDWQPAASFEILKQRSRLLSQIREFMMSHNILEVDTPILSHAGNTDPNLHSMQIQVQSSSTTIADTVYLNTSPEFAMKRLLSAGSGSIYQVSRVFRNQEQGRLHQPEFTMLEWYHVGFDHHALMDELNDLLEILGLSQASRESYAEIFARHVGIDPHTGLTEALLAEAKSHGFESDGSNRSVLLDFLFNRLVSPHSGASLPELIYDYPVSQAALARIRHDTPPVAERFELFITGVEIANGFHELIDASEQRQRFDADNEHRRLLGIPEVPVDENLIAALAHGLPNCTGVAVGIERLLMAVLGYDHIDEVVSFTYNQA